MAQVYLSQYSKRAAIADSATSASYAATASYVNPIRLDPIEDPNPTGLLYTSSTYLYQSSSNTPLGYDMYIRQDGNFVKWKWIEGMLNTGLLYGGVLTYSGSYLLITSGAGLIMNYSASTGSEAGPMANYVAWGPITQSIENIATAQNTFVYIDIEGTASQQNVFFSPEQYHDTIPIGRISHYDNVVTNGSNMNVQTVHDIDGQQNIFVRAFGPLKLTGITTSGQASTLRLNIGSGTAFNLGGYYPYDPEKPSTYNMETYNTASIIRIYRDGTGDYVFDNNGGLYYTTVDPTKYDDGTGTLATVNNNDWSIQRVMANPVTGRAHVYYGQNFYDTFDDAIGAIFSDEFVESDATAFAYPFSAYLILKGDTTDLTNTAENKIVQAGLFRNTGGGGGTGGGIPGGQDTQIQFNNNGVFDGEPEFTFDYLTNTLTLTGSMFVSGAISASFGENTVGFYGTASWAVNASQALTASFVTASNVLGPFGSNSVLSASYASSSTSASYASVSPNFANTNLVFTDNRKHDTNRYSFFLYSDLIGGNETDPFDGFGVSGSFYYFDNDSNSLGTANGSTSTYTYIEITSQSIDLSFNADPAIPSAYNFTNISASFSSSLNVTKSVYFPGLTSLSQPNVVVIDTASGQLYYLDSSSLGGETTNIAISSSGTGLTATVASINFTGTGVTATTVGDDVTVTIPGGAGVAGGNDTQIQFNSGSEFSGSNNFSFDYNNNIVYLTGSSLTSGSITLTGSMFVSGAISASFGPNTVGFFGTASWAQSASQAISSSYSDTSSFSSTSSLAYTASFITASNVWGPFGSSSVASASYASGSTNALYALTASFAASSSASPSDTYIQYNRNGLLGAEQYFRYIYASHSLQNGYNTIASGAYSHAEGFGTIATGSYSTVVGQYNIALPSQSAFIIGDGYLDPFYTREFIESYLIPGINTIDIYSPSPPTVGMFIILTDIGSGISETFEITKVLSLGGGVYTIDLGGYTTQSYSKGTDTYSLASYTRHNLLFASRSWFDVSASNVFLQGLPTSPETHVLIYNTSSGQVYYTASSAFGGGGSGTPTPPSAPLNSIQFNTASAFGGSATFTFISSSSEVYLTGSSLITGSLTITGSTYVLGTSSIDGIAFIGTSSAYALYTTAKITTINGTNTIYSLQTASYDGAFFDYTLVSGTNARAGQIMSVWSGSEIRYTETTTTDIGSTSEFIFSVALTAGSASLQVTGSTGAIIKTIIKGI